MRIVRYYPRAVAGDGGMTGAVRRWSASLARAGAAVTIVYEGAGEERVVEGVTWRPLRHAGRGWWKVPVSLDDTLGDADLLVLHSAWVLHNNWAAAGAARRGLPYLIEPRGAYDPHIVRRRRAVKRAWWAVSERRLVSHARAIHVFFDEEREHIRALDYGGAVVVAPNGVEAPSGVAWDGGSGGYLLWLGRFDPEHKGLDLLLHAVESLPVGERPVLRLHGPDYYDGTGGGKDAVRALVRRLGLASAVTIGDPVHGAQKWDLLARAAGFVYPSRWEAFGNSVGEAVSIGVPTLVTPYPLGRYLASRGGAVLAEANSAALATGLRALGASGVGEIARTGARIVATDMTWSGVARSWLSQVETLLCITPPRPTAAHFGSPSFSG